MAISTPSGTPSDETLWAAFIQGDEQAFEQIYFQSYQTLFRYGRRLTPDENLVKDCIHDLFIKLHHTRSRLRPTTSIRYYLLKSLRNLLIDGLNRDNRFYNQLPAAEPEFEFEQPIEEVIIREGLSHEQSQRVRQALETLTKRQREAVYLKFYNDLNYDEIADLMAINYQSAVNLVHQGLKLVQAHLRNGPGAAY